MHHFKKGVEVMTIKTLLETNLFDENEQIIILEGDVNYPTVHFKGYLHEVPTELQGLKIEQLSSMGKHRRNQFHLNHHGWTEIWV